MVNGKAVDNSKPVFGNQQPATEKRFINAINRWLKSKYGATSQS